MLLSVTTDVMVKRNVARVILEMSENQFKCDCGASFKSQAELDDHNRNAHGG